MTLEKDRGPSFFFGSGQKFYGYEMTREQISPFQMARTLSRIARYSGNGDRSVSVAQHSVVLSKLPGFTLDQQRAALTHDCAEALTGDCTSPVKNRCPAFTQIDERLTRRFGEIWGVPWQAYLDVREFDSRIAKDEAIFMFLNPTPEMDEYINRAPGPLGVPYIELTAAQAAYWWQKRFHELFKDEQWQTT